MFPLEKHVVNLSARGRLHRTGSIYTPPDSIQQIFVGLRESGLTSMTIYFHGGLVNEEGGKDLARHLKPIIEESYDSYPVFFIWESGALESIQSALVEINQDSPLFMRVFKKLLKFVNRKVRPDESVPEAAFAAAVPTEVDMLRAEIEAERLSLLDPAALNQLDDRLGDDVPVATDAEIAAIRAELAADPVADRALSAIIAAATQTPSTDAGVPEMAAAPTSSATGHLSSSIVSKLATRRVSDDAGGEEVAELFGLGTSPQDWFFVDDVYRNILDRFRVKSDHGLAGTVLEEIYRELYTEKIGRFIWDEIKKNATQAYDALPDGEPSDETPGGSYFLSLLKSYMETGGPVELHLTGHSAGTIQICRFVSAAATTLGPEFFVKNIVFTAAACTAELFAETILPQETQIEGFRIFNMSDWYERLDPLVKWLPAIYPHSLLYLVSGIFEDAADTALMGLARHLRPAPGVAGIPQPVADFLRHYPGSLVLSKTPKDAPPGEQARFDSHYGKEGPNYDENTLASIADMVRPRSLRNLPEFTAEVPPELSAELEPAAAVIINPQQPPDDASIHDEALLETESFGIEPPQDTPIPTDVPAVLEQIIGTNDIVDHAVVNGLVTAGRSVARIVTMGAENLHTVDPAAREAAWTQAETNGQLIQGYGTGWILGSERRVLVTNNHVLPLQAATRGATVEFGFERDLRRGTRPRVTMRLRPDELFFTSPNKGFDGLDYTVVALSRQAAEDLGHLEPVQGVTAIAAANIFIVQHPGGEGKAYVLNHNRKVNISERYVTYISDTLEGSSGSPLFDDRLRLIGLHHLGNHRTMVGNKEEITNLGSRIEAIIADLVAQMQNQGDWTDDRVRHWFGEGVILRSWQAVN